MPSTQYWLGHAGSTLRIHVPENLIVIAGIYRYQYHRFTWFWFRGGWTTFRPADYSQETAGLMNAFWNLLDYYILNRLPTLRVISDDLESDDDVYEPPFYSLPQHRHHDTSVPSRTSSSTATVNIDSPTRGQRSDHERDYDRERRPSITQRRSSHTNRENERQRSDQEQDRERTTMDNERRRLRERIAELEREKEKDRQLIKSLQSENASLQSKISPLQSSLSGAVSQISSLQTQVASLQQRNSSLDQSYNSLQSQYRALQESQQQSTPGSQIISRSPPEYATLRAKYENLKLAYSHISRDSYEQKEELKSLRTFLNRTDEISGVQIMQNLRDLNGEIVQLAATIADEFCLSMSTAEVVRPSLILDPIELLHGILPSFLATLLATRDHSSDPTIVQFAIQAWLVKCAARVFDSFCFGVPGNTDTWFVELWDSIMRHEPSPTASRWRALTYSHAHNVKNSSSFSSHMTSLTGTFVDGLAKILSVSASSKASASRALSVSPSPIPRLRTPNLTSSPASSLPRSMLRHKLSPTPSSLSNGDGPSPSGAMSIDGLASLYDVTADRIFQSAQTLSGTLKTEVMSGWLEVAWTHCSPIGATPRAQNDAGVEGTGAVSGLSRTRPRGDGHLSAIPMGGKAEEFMDLFDPATMEDVYASAESVNGEGGTRKQVLCTVEFGLASLRRTDHMPKKRSTNSMTDDAGVRRPTDSQTLGNGNPAQRRIVLQESIEKTWLMRPKVLLDSIEDIL